MSGHEITRFVKLIFSIFVTIPFRLIAKKKYYYFVPEEIIPEKEKDQILNFQIVITVILAVISFVYIRELEFYRQLVKNWEMIVPLTLILLLTIFGILLGLLFVWIYRNMNEKYDSYLLNLKDKSLKHYDQI